MRLIRLILAALAVAIAVLFCGSWYFGSQLTQAASSAVGDAPSWLPAREVEFPSGNGSSIHGWLVQASNPSAAIVLLHPVRSDRRSMLGRARFLEQSNYSLLLIDFQAHGESEGEHISFGYLESMDAIAAVQFMKHLSRDVPIVVLGSSLGGAAALLANPALSIDGLIVESVYPTIESAVRNRLRIRLGEIGEYLAPFLLLQLETRLGLRIEDLAPKDTVQSIRVPLFVISGEDDEHTTVSDTRVLYDSIAGSKQLWLVPNAAHQDLHAVAGKEYEKRLLKFIERVVTDAT